MRIVVKLSADAYPELHAELEDIPARQRAERLRVLASLGLVVGKSRLSPRDLVLPQARTPPEEKLRSIKARLKDSIRNV